MPNKLLILFLFVVRPGAVFAQEITINDMTQQYQYDQVNQILNDIIQFKNIPDATNFMGIESETDPVLISHKSLRQFKKVSDAFYAAQSNFFINNPITLKYCTKESHCGFSAEYDLKEIHFQVDLVEKIMSDEDYKSPLDVLVYISAHEVAHYVHEISTHEPYSIQPGISFHGNISSYQDHFAVFIKSLSESDKLLFFDPNTKLSKDFKRAYSVSAHRAHAEVDVIAVIKLLQLGFKNWPDVIKFFDISIEQEKSINSDFSKSVILDFENRKRVVLKTLQEYNL